MKIFIAGLLCCFIPAISARESNSSLLESKMFNRDSKLNDPANCRDSSYFVIIWKQETRNEDFEVYCSASIYSQQELLTTYTEACDINQALEYPGIGGFPKYIASVGKIEKPELASSFEIETVEFFHTHPGNFKKCALLKLKKRMGLPGIQNLDDRIVEEYRPEDNVEHFTIGILLSPDRSSFNIKKIYLQRKCEGYINQYENEKYHELETCAELCDFSEDINNNSYFC